MDKQAIVDRNSDQEAGRPGEGRVSEVLFNLVGVPRLGSLLFGFIAAILLLLTGNTTSITASGGFFLALVVLMVGLLFVLGFSRKQSGRSIVGGLLPCSF